MRHFKKKLSAGFLEDLRSYILSFSKEETEKRYNAVESAFGAMDECYQATAPIPCESDKAPLSQTQELPPLFQSAPMGFDLRDKEPSFCEKLFEKIDEKGLKDSAVYKKADIDRRLFSKIRSDSEYHPAKNTAIRLCLALELNIAEFEQLLESAGYCLSLSDTTDLVIRYCIEHKVYNIISVNEAIDYFSGKLI